MSAALPGWLVAFGTDEGEEATTFNGSIPQALMLFNGDLTKQAISDADGGFLKRIASQGKSPRDRVPNTAITLSSMTPTTPRLIHRFGAVEVNVASRVVTRNGVAVELTPREFDLLVGLLRRRGQVLSRPDLLREVWGHRGRVMTRTVDMHVVELRRKLEERPDNPRYILTVRKIGYRFSDDA